MKHLKIFALFLLIILTYSFDFKEVQSISQTSRVINTLTNLTFQLDRKIATNGISNTAFNTIPVSTNATVVVTFPSVFTLNSSITCLSIAVDSVAVTSFTCSVVGNSVIFGNVFNNFSNLFVGIVTLSIGNILNPSPAIFISNFSGSIGVDNAIPSGTSKFQLTAGALQNCSITFSPGFANMATSTLIATMTPTNPHAVGSTMTIQFPRIYWTNDISKQTLPIRPSMSCSKYLGNINSGITCGGITGTNLMTLSNIFSTTLTNQQFAIGISNFLSPPSNQPSDAIVITTFQGTFRLDTCTVFPSGISSIMFSNFTAIPLPSMTVNQFFAIQFDIYPLMVINQSDTISITFPAEITYSYTQTLGIGYYLSPPSFSGQTVVLSHDAQLSPESFDQNVAYRFAFYSVKAPPSTLTSGAITLQILRNGYPIMYGTTTLTAVSDILYASLTITNLVVWANTTYVFTVNTSNPLSSTGIIKITFPSTITPPNIQNCASILGINFNTSPRCQYDSGSNSISISNLNASSSVSLLPSQKNIIISIMGVINPSDTSITGSFTITTYYSSNTQGVVDIGTIAGISSRIATISINTVSVVPSSYVCMQSGVTYSINFNNTYLIPLNGYIIVRIPLDITIVVASLPSYCRLAINNPNYEGTTCSITSTSSYNQITFSSPAQIIPISANSLISLQIQTLCTNPTNTRIITPFSIFTFSSNAAIQSRTTGITVQMQIPASFIITQVTRASQQNSALTSYTITLKQQAALPSSTLLLINFPTEIFLTASSSCTDLISTNINCTLGSYHSIQVTLNSVASNAQFGVIINNIRNPPSYKSTTTIFTFQTKTNDLVSSYALGNYTTPFTNSIPSLFQKVTYSFAPGQYGTSQTLTVTVSPSIYIVPSSYIVSMANSFAVQNLTCGSSIGFTASCISLPTAINVSGSLGSSQVSFSVSGFTSPVYVPTDYSYLTSYDSYGFLVDQDTSTIKYILTCQIPCKSCTANASACLTCYNNSNITANNLYYSVNNSCLSNCPTGFYSTISLHCVACSSTCLTCTGSPTNCATCNSTSSYPALNISNGVGTCLPSCPTFYYLSNEISPTQCTSCVTPCLTCTSRAVCLTCAPTFYFYNMTCLGICPSNITIANNNTWNCDYCSSQCSTCLGTVSNCTSCSSTAVRYDGACLASCPPPLVISNGTCASCNNICLSCSLTSFNCTSCSTTSAQSFLLTTNTSSLGSCLAKCPFTYYGDTSQGLCKSCSLLNINCTNCSSTITCYNCDFGSGLVFYNNQCLSTTPVGFYNDSGIAKPCNSNCSSCVSATNCSSCTSLSLSINQCVSNCPSNQVSVSRVCVACNFPCLTCSVTQNNCTSCNSTILDPYYLSIGSCLQICPNFTFANSNGWTCSSCASPCEKCTSLSSCITCTNGFNLFNQTCLANCSLGFVGLNKICTPCTNNCSSCFGSTSNCLSCISGNYIINSSSPSCSTTCPVGLYPNNVTQSCTGCTSPCSFCEGFSNNCTACTSGLLQNNQCVGNCSVGYYLSGNSCPACNSNCTKCTSWSICQSCISSLVLSGSSCISNCPSSTPIVNSAGQCSTCTDPYCLNCSSINFCYQCFYPRLYFQGACVSSCPTNFVADGNYTNCIYSPFSANNSNTESTLSNSLISTSIFPVPFTIGATFLIIACLMSKFQHSRTDIIASLYALWGLLQWGSIAFLVFYYWSLTGSILKLSYLLVAGGLAWIYLINIIFLIVQSSSMKKNRRFKMWMEGSVNTCWYYTITFVSLITIGKIKFILFCKLFNFRSLSAKLDDVGGLRVLHAYAFASILSSLATMSGGIYLLIQSNFVVNQLLMAEIDVVILSLLLLIIGFLNANKQDGFFEDIDEDGVQINKRIQIKDQEHPSGVMPQFNQSDRDSFNYNYKALDSAKKLQSSYLSQISNRKSLRDVSIQAQSILGERSLISRLGTQTISQLSLFDRHDISIQMDPVRDVQDVSIAASDRKGKRHDVSVGQSVIFMDASINPSIMMKDVSVYADKVSQKDVSIDQTQRYNEQVSVQMNAQNHQISIQFDAIQQNEISIQYVPIYTDQTVHMTRQQQDLGIQCNVQHQNVSIQYSAKPLIEQVDDLLPSQTSIEVDQPSDLDLQRKLVMHPPAPQEIGMRAELQLDIHEKLQKKKFELEKLQEERKQKERLQAIKDFQNKNLKQKREVGIQIDPFEPKKSNVKEKMFENDYSSNSRSLVNSNQELTLNIGERQQKRQIALQIDQQQREVQLDLNNFKKRKPVYDHSNQTQQLNKYKPQIIKDQSAQQQIDIKNYEDTRQKDIREINNFFNNPNNNNPSSFIHTNEEAINIQDASRLKTQQQFLEMLSGNDQPQPLQPDRKKPFDKIKFEIANNNFGLPQQPSQQNGRVKFEVANNIIQNHQQIIQDDDLLDQKYEPLQQNTNENRAVQIQKSRSTTLFTRKYRKQRSNVLQSSRNSIEKSYSEQEQINNRPYNPKIKDFRFENNRIFKKQQVQQGGKTNLTQFLQKKRKNLITQGNNGRRNLIEQDDALTKQLEHQLRQKPLPAPKVEVYGSSEQSFSSYNHPNGIISRQLKQQYQQPQDLLALQVKKSLNNLNSRPNQLPKPQSKKQIESQVGIEILPKPRSKGYLRETYTSQQKKKSLEKIYLNKGKK